MNVHGEMLRAVEAARIDKLDEVNKAIWQAYGAGGLDDAQAEQLSGLLEARRTVGAAARPRLPAMPGTVAAAPALPACARRTAGVGSRPRSPESTGRRRRWVAAGYLPPALAQAFTAGEQAALAVIAAEVGKRGTCILSKGQIAALAGVCPSIVKRALRQARLLGLVSIEERRVSRHRNDTNVVRIVSREWGAWLRKRLPRASPALIGGIIVPATNIGTIQGAERQRNRGGATGKSRSPYPAAAPALAGGAH